MNYIKTVYRNGQRTEPPRVVSADEFNRILVMVITRSQNGEDFTFYSEVTFDEYACDNGFYKITFTEPATNATLMHFYEPFPDNCRNLSLFCDMKTLEPSLYSFAELERKVLDSNYARRGEVAFEVNSNLLRTDRKNGRLTEAEYQELREYNLKTYSELPF